MVKSEWSHTYTPLRLLAIMLNYVQVTSHTWTAGRARIGRKERSGRATPGCWSASRYLIRPLQLTTFITSLKGHWARTADMGVYKQPTVTYCLLWLVWRGIGRGVTREKRSTTSLGINGDESGVSAARSTSSVPGRGSLEGEVSKQGHQTIQLRFKKECNSEDWNCIQ
jgi:hypothetical protein